jgi:16S rRNA (uracil1498-N3)-methyltransferase
MKLHRFYVPEHEVSKPSPHASNESITLHSSEVFHQMKNVLKLQKEEKFIFFNGDKNEYLSHIVSYSKKNEVEIEIDDVTQNHVSFPKEVFLFFSLIKKDNVDWILQKGTEVGVSHFIPVISSRSEKKELNMERAQKILVEASEQCGRNIPPQLHPLMKLENVFNEFDLSFIVFEKDSPALKEEILTDTSIGLFVGPEGGWSKEELALFKEKGGRFCSLGETTLRAETAAIVGSALIQELK